MEKRLNFFDLATRIIFFFFLLKLMSIGFKELKRERHKRFIERPSTWLQYSQPPLIFIMLALVYAGILTDHFRPGLQSVTGFILRSTGALMIAMAGLSTLNLLLIGFALFVLTPVQFLRARKEEELFVKHFGLAYTGYKKKTLMIFPARFR